MNHSPEEIKLNREQAFVAAAFVGKNPTFDAISSQVAKKAMTLDLMRAQLPDLMPGDSVDDAIRKETPDIFTYTLEEKHKAALIGAFTLALEGTEPQEPMAIEGMSPIEVVEIAKGTRDSLLGKNPRS